MWKMLTTHAVCLRCTLSLRARAWSLTDLLMVQPAVPGDGSGLVGAFGDTKAFDFNTTIPSFELLLYLPAREFTAVLTYLDTPNFSLLCALPPLMPMSWRFRGPVLL